MDNKTEPDFQCKEYVRSRRAYCFECTFEYFVALLVTDAFLAKLLTSIGMSDAYTGIISSLIVFARLFQLLSLLVVQKIGNTKRFVVLFHTGGQLFFMLLYLVPFFNIEHEYKTTLAVICILAAYFGNYFVCVIIYDWGNSYVDPRHRAIFSANKEIISLILGIIVTLTVGYVMDYFEKHNNLDYGYIFAAIGILIFCICDFICIMLIKNRIKPRQSTKNTEPVHTVMKKLFSNRLFWSILLLDILYNTAQYTTIGFLGTYRIKELAFSVGTIQLINIFGNIARIALSRPFGRFSDKYTFAKGIQLGFMLAAASFLTITFTTPQTRYLIIIYTFLQCICQAAISQNMNNITYSYIPIEYYVQATAIKNSVGGMCGFVASIFASRLLEHIQSEGNILFGIHIYGQQVLSFISLLLISCAVLLTHFVIGKQKAMLQ